MTNPNDPNATTPPAGDPQEAIEKATGVYKDDAAARPQSETIDFMPKGQDPQPFAVTRRAGGK